MRDAGYGMRGAGYGMRGCVGTVSCEIVVFAAIFAYNYDRLALRIRCEFDPCLCIF